MRKPEQLTQVRGVGHPGQATGVLGVGYQPASE